MKPSRVYFAFRFDSTGAYTCDTYTVGKDCEEIRVVENVSYPCVDVYFKDGTKTRLFNIFEVMYS